MKLNYGEIRAEEALASEIKALGVQLGRHDRSCFVACYPDTAIEGLREMESVLGSHDFHVFPPGKFDATQEGDLYKEPSEMDQSTLYGHVMYMEFRVASTHERDHVMPALRSKLERVREDWRKLSGPAGERDHAASGATDPMKAEPYYDAKGRHYSERIIDQLMGAHHWMPGAHGSAVKKAELHTSGVNTPSPSRVLAAAFDDRGRYLRLEVGNREIFDIDARERDIAGVALEFEMRAAAWVKRELTMPVLPVYVHTALADLAASDQPTARMFDELLGKHASRAGRDVDSEMRAYALHMAAERIAGFRVPVDPAVEVISRNSDGVVTAVLAGDKTWTDRDVIDLLESGQAVQSDATLLVGVLKGLGMNAGRAFDQVYGGDYSAAAAALREIRDVVKPQHIRSAGNDSNSAEPV